MALFRRGEVMIGEGHTVGFGVTITFNSLAWVVIHVQRYITIH